MSNEPEKLVVDMTAFVKIHELKELIAKTECNECDITIYAEKQKEE